MPDTPGPAEAAGGSRIVRATGAEQREAVFRFRYDLYVDHMKKTVPAADHANRRMAEPLDRTGRLYLAEIDGQVAGTLRVNHSREFTADDPLPRHLHDIHGLGPFLEAAPGALSFTSRLMVSLDRRGSIMLTKLFAAAYRDALDAGIEFDFCYAPPYLVEMYAQLGYRRYMGNTTDPGVGYLVPMVLALRDWDYLGSLNSPMLRLASRAGVDTTTPSAAVRWFLDAFGEAAERHAVRFDDDAFRACLQHSQRPLSDASPGVLGGFSEEELRRLLRSNAVLRCAAGDRLVQWGDARDEMFIVLSGRVAVRLERDGPVLVEFGPGQVFGEMSMLTRTPRSAYVDAPEACELLIYTRQALERLMRTDPDLAARLLCNLAGVLSMRLLTTNDRLRDQQRDPRP